MGYIRHGLVADDLVTNRMCDIHGAATARKRCAVSECADEEYDGDDEEVADDDDDEEAADMETWRWCMNANSDNVSLAPKLLLLAICDCRRGNNTRTMSNFRKSRSV